MSFYKLFNTMKELFYRVYDREKHSIAPNELISRHIEDFYKYYPKQQESIHYSKEQLDALTNKRLQILLLYAKKNSPWYKKTLAKIDPEHFTKERLDELPTINKSILMEHWDEIVTNPKLSLAFVERHLSRKNEKIDTLYLLSRYHALSTGGSSGKRGVFIYDWDEWTLFFNAFTRYNFYNHDRTFLLTDQTNSPPKTVCLAVKNTATVIYALSRTFIQYNEHMYFLPMATTPLNIVISKLNKIHPDIITAPPSYIHKVCQLVQKGLVKIEPKILFIGSEPLFELTEALIKETWPNVNIFNTFACSEGLVGTSCRANTNEIHLNEDLCIVEPVDEHNHPLAKGTMASKILLTNLYNYTLPLIRYENADEILFLNKQCDCGSPHQLIRTPTGRPEFDFHYPGNIFVHHSLFLGPLLREKNIQEYQIIQTAEGVHIKILPTGFVDKDQLKEKIHLSLRQVGLAAAEVTVIEVKEFVYLPSGKFNRFIPLKFQ